MSSWITWTLLAAVMQAVRTAGQKQLAAAELSATGATLVRYLFGLPFALLYLGVVASLTDTPLTEAPGLVFWLCGLLAGVLQIVATVLLVRLFTLRNFAVGSTYARTEIMITAILGASFFMESISLVGWLAIFICVIGLVLVNIGRSGGAVGIWNRSAAYGLGAGVAFSLTSLLIRRASLSLGIDDFVLSAALTLVWMVILQTVILLGWLVWRDRGQLAAVVRSWRPSLFVGITGVAGSAGWFTAFTLERASYVKTLGQIEFLVTLAIAVYYFKERPTRFELAGMVSILIGVIVLLVAP